MPANSQSCALGENTFNVYTVVSFRQAISLEFVDLFRFNSQGKIAHIKEFLDSGYLQHRVEYHESKQGKNVETPGHIPAVKGISNASIKVSPQGHGSLNCCK